MYSKKMLRCTYIKSMHRLFFMLYLLVPISNNVCIGALTLQYMHRCMKILNRHQYILLYYMHHYLYYKTHVPVQIIYRKAPEKKTSTTNFGYLRIFQLC